MMIIYLVSRANITFTHSHTLIHTAAYSHSLTVACTLTLDLLRLLLLITGLVCLHSNVCAWRNCPLKVHTKPYVIVVCGKLPTHASCTGMGGNTYLHTTSHLLCVTCTSHQSCVTKSYDALYMCTAMSHNIHNITQHRQTVTAILTVTDDSEETLTEPWGSLRTASLNDLMSRRIHSEAGMRGSSSGIMSSAVTHTHTRLVTHLHNLTTTRR